MYKSKKDIHTRTFQTFFMCAKTEKYNIRHVSGDKLLRKVQKCDIQDEDNVG